MNRNEASWLGPLSAPLVSAGAALILAVGAGLLLTQLMMSPPASDMRSMALYLTFSGASTLAGGWLALRAADRAVKLPLKTKAFLAAMIGGGIALLNVLIMARLMFVSTEHDLPLLLAVIAFSAIVTALFSVWIATALVGRVNSITHAVRALAAAQYDTRVDVEGGDEIARLADDVNTLSERLAESERRRQALDAERQEFTSAISHDLRTPLASMRAMLEALEDGVVRETADVAKYHRAIGREIERLSGMIDDLFELARFDAGSPKLERRPLALQEVAAEVVDSMQPQAGRAGILLSLMIDGQPPPLFADGARLERALRNLVLNAIQHTHRGGAVVLAVSNGSNVVVAKVTDTGKGIAPDELPRVWERFYRGDKARERQTGSDGAGLGLAIVKGIVEAHGGRVAASSTPGKGTTFTLQLPVV